jgi:hypothetical protein
MLSSRRPRVEENEKRIIIKRLLESNEIVILHEKKNLQTSLADQASPPLRAEQKKKSNYITG